MALDKQHQSSLPFIVGQVAFFAMAAAPAGFLKCNGQAVSRTTYAALFAAIGTTYGAGDGDTTFALPDLRGEFLRGLDDGRGVDSERAIGTTQGDQMQGHRHSLPPGYSSSADGTSGSRIAVGDAATTGPSVPIGSPTTDATNGTPRVGSETRPRNIAMLACIFTGV